MDVLDRFLAKVEMTDSCWNWKASILRNGYGQFAAPGTTLAHRFSFQTYKGSIPDGLVIDHLCRNRRCVNPNHLEAVTQSINLLRGETVNASQVQRLACPSGHPYDADNTRIYRGRRVCKACESIKQARHRSRTRSKEG